VGDIEKRQGKRNIPEVHDYPLWKLEQIAEDVLKDATFCIQEYRIDIEKLIDQKYEIIIDIHYNLQPKYDVMAYMLTQSKRLFIDDNLFDNPRNAKRYRFTLAEELAHFIIHKDVYKDCKTLNERVGREALLTSREQWYMETNAKALASAILMPKSLIESRVNELLTVIGNSTTHTVSVITILSHDCDVNPRAVRRRLINLGYHKRSNLKLKEE